MELKKEDIHSWEKYGWCSKRKAYQFLFSTNDGRAYVGYGNTMEEALKNVYRR